MQKKCEEEEKEKRKKTEMIVRYMKKNIYTTNMMKQYI